MILLLEYIPNFVYPLLKVLGVTSRIPMTANKVL